MRGRFSKGGKIRPKTIHGITTGQHNNPNVLRAARASGGSCEVKQVDGKRPPMRLDRPGRWEGGDVVSDADQKSYLRSKADKLRGESASDAKSAALNAGITAFNVTAPKFTRGMARTKNAIANAAAVGTGGIALGALKDSVTKQMDASTADKEADKFKKSGGKV